MRYAVLLQAVLLFCFLTNAQTQQAGKVSVEEEFFQALLAGDPRLDRFVHETELQATRRLGITYEGVPNKFLIGYDIDRAVKSGMASGEIPYTIVRDDLGGEYTRLTMEIPKTRYRRAYYFHKGKFITPIRYYTQHWTTWESPHFRFLISDTAYFNRYAVEELEATLSEIMTLLDFTLEERELLSREKIGYVHCATEDTIELLTTFRVRGVAMLGSDEVVTTYNCHYHELMHLLINYKQRSLPLYTHPLLQEGFAAAFGGRGGIDATVLLHAANFLIGSGFLDYKELLDREAFLRQDASLTYPVAALYNYFLGQAIGRSAYLDLYRKYSRREEELEGLVIDTTDLPPSSEWTRFLEEFRHSDEISFNTPRGGVQPFYADSTVEIAETGDSYRFRMKGKVFLTPRSPLANYVSKQFLDLTRGSGADYRGEKYAVKVDSVEISVYNLYTNNRIAGFIESFSFPPQRIPRRDGWFEFSIRKAVFDEPLAEMRVR